MINSSPKTGSREDKSDAKRRDTESPSTAALPAESKSSGVRANGGTSKDSPPSDDGNADPKIIPKAESKETPKPRASSKEEVTDTTSGGAQRESRESSSAPKVGEAPPSDSPSKPRFRVSANKSGKPPTSPEIAQSNDAVQEGPVPGKPVESPEKSASPPVKSTAPPDTAEGEEAVQSPGQDPPKAGGRGFIKGLSNAVGNFKNFISKKPNPKESSNGPGSPPIQEALGSPGASLEEGKKPLAAAAVGSSPDAVTTAAGAAGSPTEKGKNASSAGAATSGTAGASNKSPDSTKGSGSSPPDKKPAVVVPPLQLNSTSGTATVPKQDDPSAAPNEDKKKPTEKASIANDAPVTTETPVSASDPQTTNATAATTVTDKSKSAPKAAASPVTSDSEQPPASKKKAAAGDKPWSRSNSRSKLSPSTVQEDVVVVSGKPNPKATETPATDAPASGATGAIGGTSSGDVPSSTEGQTAPTGGDKPWSRSKPKVKADPAAAQDDVVVVAAKPSPKVVDKKTPAAETPVIAPAATSVVTAPADVKAATDEKPVGIADPKVAQTPESSSSTDKKSTEMVAPATTPVVVIQDPKPETVGTKVNSSDTKSIAPAAKTEVADDKAQPRAVPASEKVEDAAHMLLGHQRVLHTSDGLTIDTSAIDEDEKEQEKEEGKTDDKPVDGSHHTVHVETTTPREVGEAVGMLLAGAKPLLTHGMEEEKKDEGHTGPAAGEHHSFFETEDAKADDAVAVVAAASKHKSNHDHARDIDHPLLNDSKESESKIDDGLEIRRTKNESVFESWDNAAETSIYRHVDKAMPKIREQFDYSLGDGRVSVFRRNRQKAQKDGDVGGKPLPVVKTPDQSALKIQTVFRGKKVRKHRRLQIAAVTCIQRLYRGVLSRKKFVNDVLALKVKARVEKERKKRLMAIKSKERDMMLLNSIPAEQYLNYERIRKINSAKVIQKNWRAKYTAMTGKAPPSMADVVQRATAGMKANRYPHDLHKKRITPLKEGGVRSALTGLKEDEAAKAKLSNEKEQILEQQRIKIFEYMKRMRGTEDILVARAVEQNIPYVPHTAEAVYSPDVDALGLAQLHRKIKDAAQQKSKEREQRADKLGFRHRAPPADALLDGLGEDDNKDSTRSSARTIHREEVLQHQKQMNDRGGARRKYQDLREAQQRASILMQEYTYSQPSMQARQVSRQQTLGNCQYLLETLKNPPSLDDAKSFLHALEKEQTSGMHSSNLQQTLTGTKPTAAQAKAERDRLDQAHKWFHDDVVDYSFYQQYQKTHAIEKALEAGKDTAPIEARFGQTQLEKVVDMHLRTLAAVKDKNNWGVVAIPLNVALPLQGDRAAAMSQQDDAANEVQVNVSLNRSMEGFSNALTNAKSTKNALKRETKVFRHLDSNWVKGTDAEDSLYWISYATQPSKVSVSSLTPSDVVTARQKQVIVANRKGGVTTEAPVPTSDTPKTEENLAPTNLQLLEKHAELLKEVSVEAMNHPKRKEGVVKYCKAENEKIDRLAGVFQQEAVNLIKREYSIKSGRIASREQRQQQMKAVALIQSLFRGKRARKKAAALRTQQRVLAALQNLLSEIANSDASKQKHASATHPPAGSRYGPAAVSESVDHTGPIMDYVSKIPHLQGLLSTPSAGSVHPPPQSEVFTGKESIQSANRFAKAATASEPVESSALRSPYVKSTYNMQPVATPATPHLMDHFQSVPNTGATPFVANPGSSIMKNAWAPPTPSSRSSNLAAASVGINFVDGGLSRVPSTDRDLRSSSIGTPRVASSYSAVGQSTPRTGPGVVPEDLAVRLPTGGLHHPSTTVGSIVPMSPYTPTVPEGSKDTSPRARLASKSKLSPRGGPTTPHTPGTDDKSMLSEFSYTEPQTGYISSPSQSHSSLSHSNSFSVPNTKLQGKHGGSNNRLSKHSEEGSNVEDDDEDPHEFFTGSLSSRFSPYKNSPRKEHLEGKGDEIDVKRKFQIGSHSSAKVAQTMFMVEQQFKTKTTSANSFIQSALVSQISNFDRSHAIQMLTDIARVTGVAPLSQWLCLFKQTVAASAAAAGSTPTSSTEVKNNELAVENAATVLSSLAYEFGLMGSKDGPQSEKALFSVIQMCMMLRLLGSGNESGNLKISEVTAIIEDVWLLDVRNQGNGNAGITLMWQLAQLRYNILQQATKKGGMNPRKLLDEAVGLILATAGNPDKLKSTVGGTLAVTDTVELDKQTLVQLVHQFATTEDNDATLELVDNLIKLCKWSDKVTTQSTVSVLELKELLCTLCSYRNIQRRIEVWFRAVPTIHQALVDAVHKLVPEKDAQVSTEVFCQACLESNTPLSFSESFMLAQLLTRKAKSGGLLSGVTNALKSVTGGGDKHAHSAHSSVSSSYNREGWHVDVSLLQKIKKGEYLNAVMS